MAVTTRVAPLNLSQNPSDHKAVSAELHQILGLLLMTVIVQSSFRLHQPLMPIESACVLSVRHFFPHLVLHLDPQAHTLTAEAPAKARAEAVGGLQPSLLRTTAMSSWSATSTSSRSPADG